MTFHSDHKCVLAKSLDDAISWCTANGHAKVFVIGGSGLYREALERQLIKKAFITIVDDGSTPLTCDVLFPRDALGTMAERDITGNVLELIKDTGNCKYGLKFYVFE